MSGPPNKVEIDVSYAERLFEHVICDLGTRWDVVRQSSDDELRKNYNTSRMYQYLNMARLLRQLVNDNPSLVALANRRTRMKVRFFASEYGEATQADLDAHVAAGKFAPPLDALPPGMYWKALSLDGFLQMSSLTLGGGGSDGQQGVDISVADLIDYFANCAGGVHLASYMDKGKIEQINRFNAQFFVAHGTALSGLVEAALGDAIGVALRGLNPLRKAIHKLYGTENE